MPSAPLLKSDKINFASNIRFDFLGMLKFIWVTELSGERRLSVRSLTLLPQNFTHFFAAMSVKRDLLHEGNLGQDSLLFSQMISLDPTQ